MSAPKPGDRAVVTVSVAVPPEVAFEVFTSEIDVWWKRQPQFRHAGKNAGSIFFECRLGGRLLETWESRDGAQLAEVGRITAWEPPHRFVFEWRARNFAPGETTEVEVTFDATESGTRVRLEHRGFASLPPDHPVRHGEPAAQFIGRIGLWWGQLLTSFRETSFREQGAR